MLPLRTGHSALPVGLLAAALVLGLAPAASAQGSWEPTDWTGVAAGAPAPGTDLPPAPAPGYPVPLPPAYDVAPQYEGQESCDPSVKPGAQRIADLIKATYGADQTVWIPRGCDVGGQSEHKEGRAVDWMVSVRNPQQRANAEAFLNWLLGPDQFGTPYGNAMRMGVMYIGWHDRIWRGYDLDRGWAELKGCFAKPERSADNVCHRNHIHISLSWDGATGRSSLWDGTPIDGAFCPDQSSGATTPDLGRGPVVGVEPVRVLSTRSGLGVPSRCRLQQNRWTGDRRRIFAKVTGVGAVPASGVAAVQVRVTAWESNAQTKVRVWSPGRGDSAVVAEVPMNGSAAGIAVVQVGTDGTIALSTSTGAVDLDVDVVGYFPAQGSAPAAPPTATPAPLPEAAPAPAPAPPVEAPPAPAAEAAEGFVAVGSVVGYESTADGPLKAGEARTVTLAGLPPQATSALVMVTSRDAAAKGVLRIGRLDKSPTAKMRFPKRKLHKAVLTVPVSGGSVRLKARKSAVGVRVEVLGYTTGTATMRAVGLPAKVMFNGKLKAGQVRTVKAAKQLGLPGRKRLKAVLLRIVTKRSDQDGTLSVYPAGGQPPGTRSAQIVANRRYASLVLAAVGPDGRIQVSSTVDTRFEASLVGFVR